MHVPEQCQSVCSGFQSSPGRSRLALLAALTICAHIRRRCRRHPLSFPFQWLRFSLFTFLFSSVFYYTTHLSCGQMTRLVTLILSLIKFDQKHQRPQGPSLRRCGRESFWALVIKLFSKYDNICPPANYHLDLAAFLPVKCSSRLISLIWSTAVAWMSVYTVNEHI